MTIPTLLTVKQLSVKHSVFPEGGLRWKIFNAETNGMADAGVIVRDGRRILLDEERFFTWLKNRNQRKAV
ncbi:MAG: hypothetical protein JMN25_02405 [gamma proteobacterium endosymbiont of Lamellibrachia anaximandri]|nr:hypothetical protein [gamma proteobacterium endosymbiont of Lamellibrachia anaximandri]